MNQVRTLLTFGCIVLCSFLASGADSARVSLSFDAEEADRVLAILDLRAAGKAVDDSQWQQLFAARPYQRLKEREASIAKRFNVPGIAFTDGDFKKFVLSDSLLARAQEIRNTLDRWKRADLREAAESVLRYLPATAVLRAQVYPVVKPRSNSFVWEVSTDPAIFLYLDPSVGTLKFRNTVAHELHHIGLASAQSDYEKLIQVLEERPHAAAEWMGAFGEGLAMLAAAGGPDVDPHASGTAEERARWSRDLANFHRDIQAVNAFFLDILEGKFATEEATNEKGSSFFGTQGPWYTVGYRMAVMVEKRFGRAALIQTMLDPRKLLLLYNKAAGEQSARAGEQLPLWSEEVLQQVSAVP